MRPMNEGSRGVSGVARGSLRRERGLSAASAMVLASVAGAASAGVEETRGGRHRRGVKALAKVLRHVISHVISHVIGHVIGHVIAAMASGAFAKDGGSVGRSSARSSSAHAVVGSFERPPRPRGDPRGGLGGAFSAGFPASRGRAATTTTTRLAGARRGAPWRDG